MPLYEAERLIEELNQERWTSDGPAECVNVVIDYRMDNVQDRYYLPLLIGPGQGSMLAQMQHRVEAFLKSPDMTCQDFYTAAPGLSDLLHEQFGPQLQSDLEKLGDRVLGYFQQHCTISHLEQQFEMQAEAMPVKDKKRFQESARKTVTALRRATNTGQEPGAPQHEQPEQDRASTPDHQPEQAPASAPDRQPEPDSRQRPRQSVRVQLQQIGSIKDLEYGDTITYTTVHGTRTYSVVSVKTISNSDCMWKIQNPNPEPGTLRSAAPGAEVHPSIAVFSPSSRSRLSGPTGRLSMATVSRQGIRTILPEWERDTLFSCRMDSAKHTLTQRLDQDQRKLLDQFCDALNARNTDELEHAFLVGYQTAIRLMLMGLLPMNTLLQEEPPHEE